MVSPHNGILFLHRKVLSTDAPYNMNLKNTKLCGRSRTQKDIYCMAHFYEVPGVSTWIETVNLCLPGVGFGGAGSDCKNGSDFLIGVMSMF